MSLKKTTTNALVSFDSNSKDIRADLPAELFLINTIVNQNINTQLPAFTANAVAGTFLILSSYTVSANSFVLINALIRNKGISNALITGNTYSIHLVYDGIGVTFSAISELIASIPTNFTAVATAGRNVDLSWDEVAGASYEIQRSLTSGAGFATIASPGVSILTLSNTTVEETTYYYRIRSIVGGTSSDWSNEVSVTTPVHHVPPSNLQAVGGVGQISLTWNDNTSQETGFELFRSDDGGNNYSLIADSVDLPISSVSYIDNDGGGGLAPGEYYYKVRVLKDGVYSIFSNVANATAT